MGKFIARDRKQRNKSRPKDSASTITDFPSQNPNAAIIVPETAEEKSARALRKEQLKEELRAQQNSKISSKKNKRLDKYIENKLKKEERVRLINQLKDTQVDTSLFVKTTQLGVTESSRDRLKRAIREERAGINIEENEAILYEERETPSELPEKVVPTFQKVERVESPASTTPDVAIPTAIGSGLKRPLEVDEFGLPILKKKAKRKHKADKAFEEPLFSDDFDKASETLEEGGAWEGFSSDENASIEDPEASEEDSSSENSNETEDEDDGSGEEEDEDEAEDSSEEDEKPSNWRKTAGKSEKASAFKAWAQLERDKIFESSDQQSTRLGAVPGEIISSFPSATSSKPLLDATQSEPRQAVPNKVVDQLKLAKMPLDTLLSEASGSRKAHAVAVTRKEEIQSQRLNLPIVADEQRIMETIQDNAVTILCGETGSGKTTQVPQFLFEAGYGNPDGETPGIIGVTQPRRVAAVTMAQRVAEELGEHSNRVSYQIRFEGTTHDDTAIKFMTDGVLLREMAADFALRKYSAIVIDEAHERSINTDILIGSLSRIVKLRLDMAKENSKIKPLKLIIMSATLRVDDFTENQRLFSSPPPVVVSEARQHKVTNRFSLRTRYDYLDEAYKKICKVHRRLPKGGILVFLTGKQDIHILMQKLRRTFPLGNEGHSKNSEVGGAAVQILAKDAVTETEEVEFGAQDKFDLDGAEEEDEDEMDEDSEIEDDYSAEDTTDDLVVLPLYSLLPTSEQMKIWAPLKPNQRLCVLATNVAETSLTIPGITYVIDSGRVKNRNYEARTGVQSFDVEWISKASASQRSGRAGRTGPGQCYRLYSSAVFERDFDQFAKPEILRMPIEGVVLQMKCMGIDTVVNFPFPTPPDREEVRKAEKLLMYVGALDSNCIVTDLGRTMNYFPVAPRFARMLAVGHQFDCMPYVIALVAALSVGELFVPEHQLDFSLADSNEEEDDEDGLAPDFAQKIAEDRKAAQRKSYNAAQRSFAMLDPTSDAMKLLTVVCAYEHETQQANFCREKFVRAKAMQEVRKLRQQLTSIVRSQTTDIIGQFEAKLQPPKDLQIRALQQIISTGFIDKIAIRGDLLPESPIKPSFKKVADVPYFTLFASSTSRLGAKLENLDEVAVFIHPSSVLVELHQNRKNFPEFLVYSELQKSTTSGKVRIRPLTSLTGRQLSNLAKDSPLLTFSKPLDKPAPIVKVDETTGGITRECWVIPRFGAAVGRSEQGWTLPPRRVTQKKEAGSAVWTTNW